MLQKATVPYTPTLEKYAVVPTTNQLEISESTDQTGNTYTLTMDKKDLTKSFITLAEHISIITESRKLIKEGKTLTWEEFEKEDEQKRK